MIDSMYTVRCIGEGTFEIELDREHPVLKAHFPQRAVLPGAVMLEMARRISGGGRILSIKSVKFITPLFPDENPVFVIEVKVDDGHVKAEVKRGEMLFAKIAMQVEGLVP